MCLVKKNNKIKLVLFLAFFFGDDKRLEPHGCISFKNREQVALLPLSRGDEKKTELTNHDNNKNPRTETQTSCVPKLRTNSLCMLDVPARLDIKRQKVKSGTCSIFFAKHLDYSDFKSGILEIPLDPDL